MSEPVSLADIKAHLHLEADEAGEDFYLEDLILAARASCEARIDRKMADLNADELATARHAIRLLVGDFYAGREGSAGSPADSLLASILRPLRKLGPS